MAHHIFKSLSNVTPKNTFELIKNGTRKSSEITEEIKIKLIEIKSEIKGFTQREIDQIASNVEHNLDVLRGNKYDFAYEMAGTISKPTREFLEGGAKSDVYNFVLMFARGRKNYKPSEEASLLTFYRLLQKVSFQEYFILNYVPPKILNNVIKTKDIRFSQNTIRYKYKEEKYGTVDDAIQAIKDGKITPDDYKDKIKVFYYDDKIFSLDNRRLYVFKEAGVKEIEVEIATAEEIIEKRSHLTTENYGKSVEIEYN